MVSRAIELNEQLQKVLARHEALLSAKPRSTVNHFNQEEAEEEEEAEQLFRRYVASFMGFYYYLIESFWLASLINHFPLDSKT